MEARCCVSHITLVYSFPQNPNNSHHHHRRHHSQYQQGPRTDSARRDRDYPRTDSPPFNRPRNDSAHVPARTNASTNYNQNQHGLRRDSDYRRSYPPPFNGPPNVTAHGYCNQNQQGPRRDTAGRDSDYRPCDLPPFNGPPNDSVYNASERAYHEASQNDSARQYTHDMPKPPEETQTLVPLEAKRQQQPSTHTAAKPQILFHEMNYEQKLIAQVSY